MLLCTTPFCRFLTTYSSRMRWWPGGTCRVEYLSVCIDIMGCPWYAINSTIGVHKVSDMAYNTNAICSGMISYKAFLIRFYRALGNPIGQMVTMSHGWGRTFYLSSSLTLCQSFHYWHHQCLWGRSGRILIQTSFSAASAEGQRI